MGLVSSAIRQLYSIINNLFFLSFFFFNGLQFKITSEGLTALQKIELYSMVIIAQLPYNSHFTSYCFISLSNNLQDKQLPTYCGKTCNGTVVFMTTDYTNLERLIQSGRDLSKSSSSTSCSKKVLFMRTSCSCLAESISEVMELPKMFWASCSSV